MVEIDIIKEEQIKIINYNAFLEDRRLRFVDFIRKNEDLKVSETACKNLINCVAKLEVKVIENPELRKGNPETNTRKVCRYDRKGYCKYQKKCKFFTLSKFVNNS